MDQFYNASLVIGGTSSFKWSAPPFYKGRYIDEVNKSSQEPQDQFQQNVANKPLMNGIQFILQNKDH